MKRKKLLFIALGMSLMLIGGTIWAGVGRPTPVKRERNPRNERLTLGSFFTDPYIVRQGLEIMIHEFQSGGLDKKEITELLKKMTREMEGSERFYEFESFLNISKKGISYGASKNEFPIGGGSGYGEIIKTGDYIVNKADDLVEALEKAKSGDVIFIPGDARIDMTEYMMADQYDILLNEGVTLASDRGYNGSKGGLLFTSTMRAAPFINAGKDSRITGLRIQGPDAEQRDWKNRLVMSGIKIEQPGVTVDNCEISAFNYAGIEVASVFAEIRYNYIHHIQGVNRGFGISVDGAKAIIENNLFNNLNVCVKGIRRPVVFMEIRNNVDMGNIRECFLKVDRSKKEGSLREPDCISVIHNTLLSESQPFQTGDDSREYMKVTNNCFFMNEEEYSETAFFNIESNVFGLRSMVNESSDRQFSLEKFALAHTPDMRLANITSRIHYCDLNLVHDQMTELAKRIDETELSKEELLSSMCQTVKAIEGYDSAYEYLDQPYVLIEGQKYGAIPDSQPLGGGYGYHEIFTTGDYVVETTEEFIEALSKAKEGDVVFVKENAVIDLTTVGETLTVNSGVTIASNRGYLDSPGGLIYCDAFYAPIFRLKENVRITGICIKGPDPEPRLDFHKRSFAGDNPKGLDYYFKLVTMYGLLTDYSGLQVDNCELAGFSTGAISISGESKDHHIHHNYIHHNQRNGLGYGVSHGKAISLIEYNLFDYNRHDIQGSGEPGSGYEARHNLQMGHSLSHCFDMHGGSDRKDGTTTAGGDILMHHNTFLSEKYPYLIRGLPTGIQDFYRNAVYEPLSSYERGYLYGWDSEYYKKFLVRDNVFDLKNNPMVVP